MTYYYAVLAAVAVAALVFAMVRLVETLTQVRLTAAELEALARKANAEMDKVGQVTNAVSGLAGVVSGGGGRLAANVAGLVFTLFQKFRRDRPVEVPSSRR
jgi:hypothetical protein